MQHCAGPDCDNRSEGGPTVGARRLCADSRRRFGRPTKLLAMEAPPVERRLAAILAADVEGYSRLMHRDEEATLATLSAHRALVDGLIARHRGRIANTAGDSVLAEFASVLDAVSCAIAIQNALAAANEGEPEEHRMQFRIGINVGDVMLKDGDVFGDGVNVAARLEGLVKGGEICVSRGVRDHLRHRGGMVFDDLGEQLVKNIAHPVRAFRLREVESPRTSRQPKANRSSRPLKTLRRSYRCQPMNRPRTARSRWSSLSGTASRMPARTSSKTYLEKYPEGNFAALARTRIEAVARSSSEAEEPAPAAAVPDPLDLTFWNSVKDSDRREELEAYLQQHPDGHFAGLARARLSAPI